MRCRFNLWATLLITAVLALAPTSIRSQQHGPALPGANQYYAPRATLGFEERRECVAGSRFWMSADFLLWWMKGQDVPPLVTTGPPTQAIFPGVLGLAGTNVVLGNDRQNLGAFPGGRFTLGGWMDPRSRVGLEANYLFVGRQSASRTVQSPGTPPLSIPFFDFNLPGENTTGLASEASFFSGVAQLSYTTRLQGAEANGIVGLIDRGLIRIDGLIGFRWLNLDESLAFDTSSPSLPPFPPSFFITRDRFETRNDFYGGQLGLRTESNIGRFFLLGAAKVALGSISQTTRISGALITDSFATPGVSQSFPGGYFTAPTNIGEHHRSQFAVVPEVNLSAGVHVRENIRVSAGYSFLYLSSVARPGDQIDRSINASQLPGISGNPLPVLIGPARPAYLGNDSSFWAHGLNVGVEVRY